MVEMLSARYPKQSVQLIYGDGVGISLEEFLALPAERRSALRFVAGHFEYGIHEWLARPSWYVTVVRDPVSRVRSLFDHFRRFREPGPATAWHDWIQAENPSVGRFVRQGLSNQTDNGMVRAISSFDPPVGGCDDKMLDVAKRRLDTFAAVVIFEQLADGIARLEGIVGAPLGEPPRSNVTADATALTEDDMTAIREANRLDIALYEHALERWGNPR